VAADILALHVYGEESSIHASHAHCGRVQDAYSLRCIPQVHGIALDTLRFVRQFLTTELNSATDNPMIFPDNDVKILSGGNFHGEYPAKLADFLAIGIHEVANISVTRIERLMNPHMSGLPAFLVTEGGINSGFMIAHCTAAALVSENKTLCHPASVDSIPTSAGQEDHVSMGAWGARKALSVVANVERVLAIELQAACQALDILRPLRSTEPLEKLYETVRSVVPYYESDHVFSQDIEKVAELIRSRACLKVLEPYLSH
jgi:histidine ammonia-lyase